jgi:hypothetical protein
MEEIRPMPRTAQSRTNLPQSLHRDLSLYALAAGAAGVSVLALAQPADAEVVYTEVHQIINHSQSYAIDLNHDGVTDFTIHNISVRCTRTFSYCPVFQLNVTPATPMNGVQKGFRTSYAAALLPGAEVGPSKPIKHGPAIMADQFRTHGSFYYFGSWQNVTNQYLGLEFKIDGQMHYGWARLSVQSNHKFRLVAAISGFAYETVPNKPIIAGDTGSGSADDAGSSPTSEMFSGPQLGVKSATLGALALGSAGLTVWRRP